MNRENLRNQPLAPGTPHRITLVDGDKKNHLAIRQALSAKPGAWVLECHTNTKKALRRISLAPPHVVIMELALRDSSGIDFLVKLKGRLPELAILVFTECRRQREVELCLMAGANGFLVKPLRKRALLRALGDVMAGRVALCEKARAALLDSYQRVSRLDLFQNLSVCERAIVLYLLNGFSENQIAPLQKKTAGTVHVHLVNLYHKLKVNSRAEVLKKFFRAMHNTQPVSPR